MTDTDNGFEGAPTAPLPIAESAGVTAPFPQAEPASAVPGVTAASAPHRSGRLSTGGIVAIALAGAMAISAVSFGAGWGAHGMASRFGDRRAVAQRAMMGYGNGQSYGRGDSRGQGQGYGYGNDQSQGQVPNGGQGWSEGDDYGNGCGRGMAPQGGWGDQQSQDGWGGQGGTQQDGAATCPHGTW